MRLMQHKKEAYWFYRFLSIFYDDLVNPLFWTVPMREKALAIADLQAPKGSKYRVVDVGSGTGFTTEGIVGYVKPRQVTSIDQSPHQMAKAKAKEALQGVKFKLGDAEDIPMRTNHYDRYVSAGSIEYWPHPAQGVREAYRVIKPGGRATIIGPIEPPTAWGRFLSNTWMLFPKEREYRAWYEQAGFTNVQVEYLDPGWYRGTDSHFALAIAGDKPEDGPNHAPDIYEPRDEELHGVAAAAKTVGRVIVGSAAGGLFIPMALGAKAIAAVKGTDDPREPLTVAQKVVLVGVAVALAAGLASLFRHQGHGGAHDDRHEDATPWPEGREPAPHGDRAKH